MKAPEVNVKVLDGGEGVYALRTLESEMLGSQERVYYCLGGSHFNMEILKMG